MRESQLLTNENVLESLKSGIDYAKEAVELDSTDGESWTILGNAYLSLFFKRQEEMLLRQAINSFGKAVSLNFFLTYKKLLNFTFIFSWKILKLLKMLIFISTEVL